MKSIKFFFEAVVVVLLVIIALGCKSLDAQSQSERLSYLSSIYFDSSGHKLVYPIVHGLQTHECIGRYIYLDKSVLSEFGGNVIPLDSMYVSSLILPMLKRQNFSYLYTLPLKKMIEEFTVMYRQKNIGELPIIDDIEGLKKQYGQYIIFETYVNEYYWRIVLQYAKKNLFIFQPFNQDHFSRTWTTGALIFNIEKKVVGSILLINTDNNRYVIVGEWAPPKNP